MMVSIPSAMAKLTTTTIVLIIDNIVSADDTLKYWGTYKDSRVEDASFDG